MELPDHQARGDRSDQGAPFTGEARHRPSLPLQWEESMAAFLLAAAAQPRAATLRVEHLDPGYIRPVPRSDPMEDQTDTRALLEPPPRRGGRHQEGTPPRDGRPPRVAEAVREAVWPLQDPWGRAGRAEQGETQNLGATQDRAAPRFRQGESQDRAAAVVGAAPRHREAMRARAVALAPEEPEAPLRPAPSQPREPSASFTCDLRTSPSTRSSRMGSARSWSKHRPSTNNSSARRSS
jgi:hypothetical protein